MAAAALGKWLIVLGLVIAAVGGLMLVFDKVIRPLARLPGDIHIQKEGFTFHFPIVTCLVVSVVITVLLNLLLRWFRG